VAIDTYAYDATGNRTALTTAGGTASYTYPLTAAACSPSMARRTITTRQATPSALAARRFSRCSAPSGWTTIRLR